jgi:WD40 repeat protein
MKAPADTLFPLSPYPGLRPFHDDEVELFFGREEQTDQLLDRLYKTRLLAVVGPSGCGKSSLVRAGMIAALQTGLMSGTGAHWRIAEMRPGGRPLWRLASALAAPLALDIERSGGPTAVAFADATLRRGRLGLVELLQERWLPEGANLLLLVDQFEEIFRFRQEGSANEADAFVALLLASAAQSDYPVYVVLTMRSDFLGECALFHKLPEAINDGQYLTPRMTREQTRSAIVGPARVFDADVEPALVTQLLNEIGSDTDQLPLLQHALMRMWQHMQARTAAAARAPEGDSDGDGEAAVPVLTMADYAAVGSIAKALSTHVNQVHDSLAPRQQRTVELMFRRLTHRAIGKRDTRRPARLSDVAAVADVAAEDIMEVVEAFRQPDRSFVTPPVGVGLSADTILDIGHESLIRQWDRLNAWVDAEARSADMYFRLKDSARREQAGRAAPWRPPELDEGLMWREQEAPNEAWARRYGTAEDYALAMRFLDRSAEQQRVERELAEQARRDKEEAERQRREERELWVQTQLRAGKRFRLLAMGMGALAVVALVLLFAAVNSTRRADAERANAEAQAALALARQLNASAEAAADATMQGLERSLLLTLESLHTRWTPEGHAALLARMDLLPDAPRRTWRLQAGRISALAPGPDERWLAVAAEGGTYLLRAEAAAEPTRLSATGHGDVPTLAASADGRWLAARCDVEVCLYDSADWQVIRRLPVPRPAHSFLRFSPDGRWLAAVSFRPPVLKLYDTATWQERASADMEHEPAWVLQFSPDGQRLASSGSNRLRLWRTEGLQPLASLEIRNNWGEPLAVSPDGHFVAVQGEGDTLQLVDIVSDEGATRLAADPARRMLRASSRGPAVFSADGRHVAVTQPGHDAVLIGDVDGGRERTRIPRAAGALAFIQGGHLLTGNLDGTVDEWEAVEKGVRMLPHGEAVRAVAFSPDGRRLATATDTTLRIFDTANWTEAARAIVPAAANGLAFSHDGRWLAAIEDGGLRLIDTASEPWHTVGPLPHEWQINAVAFSPDGRSLATTTAASFSRGVGFTRPTTRRVWSLADGSELGWMFDVDNDRKGPYSTFAAAQGSLDKLETTAGGDRTLAAQAASWPLAHTPDRVASAPDLPWLKSLTARKIALVGSAVERVARAQPGRFSDSAFSADGRWLATAGEDGKVRLWHLAPDDLAADTCARLTRNLSCDEWGEILPDKPYRKTCPALPDPPGIAECRAVSLESAERPTPAAQLTPGQ